MADDAPTYDSDLDELENSEDLGSPVELYLFRYGPEPHSYFAYTNAEQEISADSNVYDLGTIKYEPIPISRGEITANGTLDKAALEIRTPQTITLAALFKFVPPSNVVTLTIYQGHENGETWGVCWAGRVLSAASEINEKVFSCEPASTSLKRPGLRRNWQYSCPHVLYGPDCKADEMANSVNSQVVDVDGPITSLPDGWSGSFDPQRFEGGYVSWQTEDLRTERRSILRLLDANTVLLGGRTLEMVSGIAIRLTLGCGHTMDDCTLFNNIYNFGGDPWIPTVNPFGVKNDFY